MFTKRWPPQKEGADSFTRVLGSPARTTGGAELRLGRAQWQPTIPARWSIVSKPMLSEMMHLHHRRPQASLPTELSIQRLGRAIKPGDRSVLKRDSVSESVLLDRAHGCNDRG